MSKNETFDKIFDALLDEALDTIKSQPDANLPEEIDHTFSKEHEEKMKKLFAKERAKIRRRKAFKQFQRVAACFLAVVIVSGVTVMSVDAFRIKFLNFIFDTQQTNTEIKLKDKNTQYSNGKVSLGYIPEEFELYKEEMGDRRIYLKFKSEEKYFTVLIDFKIDNKSIDTENAITEVIAVNNMEAIYSENENGKVIVMHDDEYIYLIKGNISKTEIVEIARNIIKR